MLNRKLKSSMIVLMCQVGRATAFHQFCSLCELRAGKQVREVGMCVGRSPGSQREAATAGVSAKGYPDNLWKPNEGVGRGRVD